MTAPRTAEEMRRQADPTMMRWVPDDPVERLAFLKQLETERRIAIRAAAEPYRTALERLDQFATDNAYAADDWVWTPEGERELWNIVTEARALLRREVGD